MRAISRAMSSRGMRKRGMTLAGTPPGSAAWSKTVTGTPARARWWAQDRPAGPAPITATLPGKPAAAWRPSADGIDGSGRAERAERAELGARELDRADLDAVPRSRCGSRLLADVVAERAGDEGQGIVRE